MNLVRVSMIINGASNIQFVNTPSLKETVKSLDNIISESDSADYNFGFKLMYDAWMQKILMSDGVNDEENFDW